MSLDVIGVGFGRTGTLSLKYALQQLGVGPCYHMVDVLQNPSHTAIWSAAADGKDVDWETLFAGFKATVDWPGTYFWRLLAKRYPQAKVLLSVRPEEAWYKSARDTIYALVKGDLPSPAADYPDHHALVKKIIWDGTFGGRFEDRAHALAVYERHNQEVRQTIPPEKLLVYQVGQGWEPLCRFLGRPIPDEPYPAVNSTEEFAQRVQGISSSRQD